MLEPIRLSLETFQPEKCYPPYLNTPRSLEACRINGINPVELVLIPYAEFQKDFPNDADAAQRRYERIEGGRARTYAAVMRDWKKLCDSGWVPPDRRISNSRETILHVPPQVHCTLLELQAAKFRKIEQDNWEALQRNLKMEIIKADIELKNQKVLQKQEDLQEANDHFKLERKLHLELMEHDHIQALKRAEEERQLQIKLEQEQYNAAHRATYEEHKRNQHRDRLLQEKRQQDQVARDEYTRQMKDSIMNRIDKKYSERRKSSEMKSKFNEDRINQFLSDRERDREQQKNAVDAKLAAIKEERERREALTRQQQLDEINKNERRRQAIEDERERQRQTQLKANDNDAYEKTMRIKESTEQMVRQKSEHTLNQLRYKDDIARQELEKVREAQERRRRIKAIRREAYEIAAFRRNKAEEYRRAKLAQDLKDKEDRMAAIKKGFHVLEHMRTSMRDIIEKTNTELKEQFDHLKHVGEFSPNRVVQTALAVSDQVLFPRLQRTFGIVEDDGKDGQNKNGTAMSRLFLTGGDEQANKLDAQNSADMPLFEGDRTMPALTRPRSSRGGHGHNTAQQREDTATLPVKLVTQDHLKDTLMRSMKMVEDMNTKHEETERNRRSRSPHGRGGKSAARRYLNTGPSSPGYGEDDLDLDDEGGSNGGGPSPILRMQGEDGGFEDMDNSYSHKAVGSKAAAKKSLPSRLRALPRSDANAPDPNLPMYPFTAGQEFADNGEGATSPLVISAPSPQPRGKPRTKSAPRSVGSSREELRTDKNDKAKYLQPPAGRFRKEFSLDHPLAANGTGRYRGELKQGLKPAYMDAKDLEGPGRPLPKVKNQDVQATLALAEKVEKLTYDAQTTVVDKDTEQAVDRLKAELDKTLLAVIEEEQQAEEARADAVRNIVDPLEKSRIEQVFAEERARASERLIMATKEHDHTIKSALLKTMNLGSGLSS